VFEAQKAENKALIKALKAALFNRQRETDLLKAESLKRKTF
jgi:hypothetical protein